MVFRFTLEDSNFLSVNWWNLFTDHLSTAIDRLHRPIKDIFLLDHLDCGAYKELYPSKAIRDEYKEASLNRMREIHERELTELANRIHEYCESKYCSCGNSDWENIRVSCFIVDLRGVVTQLEN